MRKFLTIALVVLNSSIFGQTAGKLVRTGNYRYLKDDYKEAEIRYREALDIAPDMPAASYNLGNAKYKKEEFEEAINSYTDAIRNTNNPDKLSDYYYNLGNAYFKENKFKESAEAYKQALRNNADNENARHNLFLAQQMLKQQQQKQQQQNKDQKPPEPSEFAKQLKKQAQELVNQRRYAEAYQLMIDGEQKDKTVATFRSFTDKIKEVDDINRQ